MFPMPYSDEELKEYLVEFHKEYDNPTNKKFRNDNNYPSCEAVRGHFGSWNQGKIEAGILEVKHQCLFCKDKFSDRRSLGIHLKKKHNTSIPKICSYCHQFYSNLNDKFCSKECSLNYHREAGTFAGKNNPNYKGKNKICLICKEIFKAYGTKVRKTCSNKCHGKWKSINYSGENHPNYKHGNSVDKNDLSYAKNWKIQREKVIKRDNEECQSCGITRQDHKEKYDRDLSVDHITPRYVYIEDSNLELTQADYLHNLITYCVSCHHVEENKKNF